MTEITITSTPSESYFHKAIKKLLYDKLYEENDSIIERSIEKYIGKRFADIYFKFENDQEVVIEVQNSYIPVREIIKRTEDYNKLGIYVMWILHGEGNSVATSKFPKDVKDTRISLAENYLFRMYGGRVYYLNLKTRRKEISISNIFALYFAQPFKKNRRELFKSRYSHFYIRDSLHTPIRNFSILCTKLGEKKIARFYDKNLKRILKDQVKSFYSAQLNLILNKKKILRLIISHFKKKYGLFLVYNSIIELTSERSLNFDSKLIKKLKKKVS